MFCRPLKQLFAVERDGEVGAFGTQAKSMPLPLGDFGIEALDLLAPRRLRVWYESDSSRSRRVPSVRF